MTVPPGAAWSPPARDGVSPSRLVVAPGTACTLADYLGARLRSGIDWRARLAQGDVVDAQGRALAADAPCVPGQVLWYWRWLPPEPRVPFELVVLHQDAHLWWSTNRTFWRRYRVAATCRSRRWCGCGACSATTT